MPRRTLTITLNPDWRGALHESARRAQARSYEGETLNFEDPGMFFGRLSERRWALLEVLLGAGEIPVRELARRVKRDVRRVHEDVTTLADLGLVERTETGGVQCPFADIHVDMHLHGEQACA